MELTLKRFAETHNSTAGTLWHGDKFLCFIIEDGHHEPKIKGITRIPTGTYPLQKSTDTRFNAAYQTKFNMNWVMRVFNVPNFVGIEIHAGNGNEDTDGCLLPNSSIEYAPETNTFYGGNSLRALRLFYDYLDPITEPITLTIIDPI